MFAKFVQLLAIATMFLTAIPQISTAQVTCGGDGETVCDLFRNGKIGCNVGLQNVQGTCRLPGDCGGQGNRLCFLFIDGRGGCNTDLVDVGRMCVHPGCGANGQGACAIFGRNSCDTGMVEVNDSCFVRGECGAAAQRACLVGEGTTTGCHSGLVEQAGKCVRPNCGALGQNACAILGRNSCDSALVEVNNQCFTRGDCGATGQRACLIGERNAPSCDANLVEQAGTCVRPNCGALAQNACSILGRNSCDNGLVEVNNQCFTTGDCGASGQRACLIGERNAPNCDVNLVEMAGRCVRPNCGALGQNACAILGRNSCDNGLVEVNSLCLIQGDCGASEQRACLIGERNAPSCDANLVEQGGKCLRPNCGALGQSACAIMGRNSCDDDLVEMNNQCFTRADCGAAGQRACLIGERDDKSCDANLVEQAGQCVRTNCGQLNQAACAVIGRNSCDDGLVEVNDQCFTQADCGARDQRACLIGERAGKSCDTNLVERGGVCVTTTCGKLGGKACGEFGRNSCDDGSVEVNGVCFAAKSCGADGQRACQIIERGGSSCDSGSIEWGGDCYACGAEGQRACANLGRNSCDDGLVEFNNMCFIQADCGSAGKRSCLIGERPVSGCDPNLMEIGGKCHQCGELGQLACKSTKPDSCDDGLVPANGICFAKSECGTLDQRVCMADERAEQACDDGLTAESGVCRLFPSGNQTHSTLPLVTVVTDPPAPAFFARASVALVAATFEPSTRNPMVAEQIEILQARYDGPGSKPPVSIKVCLDTATCRADISFDPAEGIPAAISYMARVTKKGSVFESPIRITDLRVVDEPVRMNVSAELTSRGGVTQLPHQRTIDIIFFAGGGYEKSSKAFMERLVGEFETMMGVSDLTGDFGFTHRQPSTLAENYDAVSFYVSSAPAIVNPNSVFGMCEHSTISPVPFGDAQGILHPNLDCRDWSVPGPFYSARDPDTSWHEMHHAAFGLSDEYCEGTVHFQNSTLPNVYNSAKDCRFLSTNPTGCMRIEEPQGCTATNSCTCSTSYWRSDAGDRDVMRRQGIQESDDIRSTRGKFAECRAGRC